MAWKYLHSASAPLRSPSDGSLALSKLLYCLFTDCPVSDGFLVHWKLCGGHEKCLLDQHNDHDCCMGGTQIATAEINLFGKSHFSVGYETTCILNMGRLTFDYSILLPLYEIVV